MARRARRARASFVVTVAVAAAGSGACGGDVASSGSAGAGGSGGTGNPPGCPSSAPADGASCALVGQVCDYDGPIDDCGQPYEKHAVCSKDGTWSVSTELPGTSCNPPPPPRDVCPAYEPSIDGFCDTAAGLICTYPASCCSSVYECVSNQWKFIAPPCNPPIPICPETQPQHGAPCEEPCGATYTCEYGSCGDGGIGATTATCKNGSWEIISLDCG